MKLGPLTRLARGAINRVRAFSLDPDIRANKAQRLSGHLPEPDFELFGFMDQAGGLIVDAGANRGHCSLAILSSTSSLDVVAFEPIDALARPLEWIRRQYPARFRYHLCALGSSDRSGQLFVPTAGRSQATTNASIRSSEFDKDYVRERLAEELGTDFRRIEFPARPVAIRTLDSFEFRPLGIKIDVEGLEGEVIEGGQETLSRHKPMLMIEMNNTVEYLPRLESMGYRFYRFDPGKKRLLTISHSEIYLNVICLHPARPLFPSEMFEG